jgi:chromosome segregation ATPase
MGSFKRALFGYDRRQVDLAVGERDARAWALERDAAEARQRELEAAAAAANAEAESTSLAGMVLDREREIRELSGRLAEADQRHDRNIASLEAVSARLEELQSQARGQATRIRMKALREAVEVSRRVQALTDAYEAEEGEEPTDPGLFGGKGDGLFEGKVRLEIGPLGDFSQLVGVEDAIGQLGAAEISVERFSEGRATLSMRLDQPTELLRELEELSELDFRVRHTGPDNLILDLDEEQGPDQQAA